MQNLFPAGVGLLALFGAWLITYSTVKGLSGSSDSVAYLVSARNLVRGIGIGYYFPGGRFYQSTIGVPFYIIALGAVAYFKVDVLQAARVLDVLFLVVTLLSLGVLFHRFSGVPSFALLASLILFCFTPFFRIFISAMTESLYFPLFIGCAFCLLSFINRGRILWLVLSAVLTGLLTITRYDGIPIILVGVVCLFVFNSEPPAQRLKKAALYAVLVALPLLIWGVSIRFHIDQPTVGTEISLSGGVLAGRLQQFRLLTVNLIWNWIPFHNVLPFFTYRLRLMLILFVGVVVLGVTLFASRLDRSPLKRGDFQIFSFFGLSALAGIVFLVFTTLVFGLPARLDDRQLLPFGISTFLCLIAAVACWLKAWFQERRWMQLFPWLVAGVFIYGYLPGMVTLVEQSHQEAADLAYRWRSSTLIQAVQALPKDIPIISNGQDLILFWADRPSYDLVNEIQPGFLDQATPYGSDLSDRAQVAFREQGAALVIFGGDRVFAQELENSFGEKGRLREPTMLKGLVLFGKYPDGRIYFASK
ncbi:MAG: glycosyltransferase family 39 protein [Anaerolineales bacterium]